MGRAERRRAERRERIDNRKGKILMTRKDIAEMKKEISEYSSNYNVEALMTCFALTGRRLHGYGQKRILRDLQYIDDLMGEIINETATIEDFKKELEDETGMVIKC